MSSATVSKPTVDWELFDEVACTEKTDIKKDELFTEENLDVKGPAKGLSPQFYYELLGKKSKRDIKKGAYLYDDDI